ncbi:MAG TPA: Stp1/IreP family PP2C-type Ser/Thr phosphatase [Egibacteraceae bacterium]|nr:Stp1/IreP family PP2C-type Ser/Thr phosphatase [Egibacteraceae bacterium]
MTERTSELTFSAGALTDTGRVREQNEDNLFSGSSVFAVADGMGGHQAGEIASEMALQPIADLDGRDFVDQAEATRALAEAIRQANRSVIDKAASDPSFQGMGTTLTAVLLRDGKLHVGHVGDSRAYLLRYGERINQLTTDHTLVEQLVQEGRLSRDQVATHPQRSVITRAIGVEPRIEVDTLPPIELQAGDVVLLCSDGLSGLVSDERIASILRTHTQAADACRALVDAANARGGHDNISVVVVRADGDRAHQVAAVGAGSGSATTQELDPVRQKGPDTPPKQIRTRQETGGDWASKMGRYGDQQGFKRSAEVDATSRGRRGVAMVMAAIVLLGVIFGGGWFLLSRAYFVGEEGGQVAVFKGLPQEVAGVPLHWVAETTDVRIADLPVRNQSSLGDGIPVGTLGEAKRLIDTYRSTVEERALEEDSTGQDTSSDIERVPTQSPEP